MLRALLFSPHPPDATISTMATPHNVTMAFTMTFLLTSVLVALVMLTILAIVTMMVLCFSKGRGKPQRPTTIRRVHTVPRANPYSDASSSVRPSSVPPSWSGADSLQKVPPHTSRVSTKMVVDPNHSTKPNHSPLPPAVSLHVPSTTAATSGHYDTLAMDILDGCSLVCSHDNSRESTSSLSRPYKKSHGLVNTSSPCPTHSYSDSHRRPAHDPIYCERLEPSMLQRAGPQARPAQQQGLPFAPMYATPKALRRNERPLTIPKDHISELRDLGVGQFGQVVLAGTKGLSPKDLRLGHSTERNRSLLVAIKKLRQDADEDLKKSFECEIKFMSRLKHSNVVRLLGVSDGVEPFIVMEYMENGDLHGFLRKHKVVPDTVEHINENEVTPQILMYLAVQIANGMRYLASLRFVHRDLATRNCLVGRDFVVKVSDFGMSCSLYQSFYYLVQGRLILPIRWMAFESFYGKFSVKSDAWSYGVTMWEIFTLAQSEPYSEMSDEEVIADAIKGAGRKLLPMPPTGTKEVYDVMLRCWVHEPVIRADFEEVYSRMFLLYTRMSDPE